MSFNKVFSYNDSFESTKTKCVYKFKNGSELVFTTIISKMPYSDKSHKVTITYTNGETSKRLYTDTPNYGMEGYNDGYSYEFRLGKTNQECFDYWLENDAPKVLATKLIEDIKKEYFKLLTKMELLRV